jgi:hypothetical protein
VKWQSTPAFDADLRRLSPEELRLFRKVVRETFVPAAERSAGDPLAASRRPRHLRRPGALKP